MAIHRAWSWRVSVSQVDALSAWTAGCWPRGGFVTALQDPYSISNWRASSIIETSIPAASTLLPSRTPEAGTCCRPAERPGAGGSHQPVLAAHQPRAGAAATCSWPSTAIADIASLRTTETVPSPPISIASLAAAPSARRCGRAPAVRWRWSAGRWRSGAGRRRGCRPRRHRRPDREPVAGFERDVERVAVTVRAGRLADAQGCCTATRGAGPCTGRPRCR